MDFDEAADIIDGCIEAQRNLLCGFFGNSQSNLEKLKECKDPNNAAISLAGEPMLYPLINDLLTEFKKQSFTTFLVSNGMTPSRLENLNTEPTQLYLSLDAPSEKIYQELCQPQLKKGWEQLNKSLDLLTSFNCRTVIRMTCVKDYNMTLPEEYAKMINRSNPDFVEVKAYMYVGSSRKRLKLDNMPHFSEIQDFANSVAELCNMDIINGSQESRVVLLA
jgi:tRNA wybutosine-synthesizing protein 1